MSVAQEYLSSFRTFAQIPMIKQLIFIIGVAGGVALGIALYMSIEEPVYRPLDYQITQQNMSTIVDTLEKSGIRYKLDEQDNVILVPDKDLQRAKLKLSATGVPKDDGMNFSFLNDQNNIANSQFMENARYLRALENDLAKTIRGIEGVSSARVHIAIPQNNVFADENGKPSASVFLTMGAGVSSDKDKIRSIVQIVSGSVPGLDPKDVSITDQYGHYLSGEMDPSSLYNAAQLTYQNSIQSYYEKRIESLIVPLVGNDKISVRVYANIDYTQQEEAKEQYDPDEKAVRSEQSVSEQGGGGASGAPGSLSNSPPGEGDKSSAPQSSGGSGRSESIKNYELGKSVSYKKSNAAKVTNLSVAVVVDNETVIDPKTKKTISKPIDADRINKITELVKATIGYNEARGDRVTVINSNFTIEPKPEIIEETRFWNQVWFWDIVKKTIGITLGFALIFVLYRRLNSFMNSTSIPRGPQPKPSPVAALGLDEKEPEITAEMHQLKQEKINQLKELANLDPNKVASVIKNWVGK